MVLLVIERFVAIGIFHGVFGSGLVGGGFGPWGSRRARHGLHPLTAGLARAGSQAAAPLGARTFMMLTLPSSICRSRSFGSTRSATASSSHRRAPGSAKGKSGPTKRD